MKDQPTIQNAELNLPDIELSVNGQLMKVHQNCTIEELLAKLGRPKAGLAVEVNEAVIAQVHHAEHQLLSGDSVEVVSLVGGG